MSTKIYNAYILKKGIGLTRLLKVLKGVRNEYQEEAVDVVANAIAGKRKCFRFECDDPHKYRDAVRDKLAVSMTSVGRGPEYLPLNASVVVYQKMGRIVVQVFCMSDHPSLINIITDAIKGIASDYHYQNSADPWYDYEKYIHGMTDETYAAHEKDWKEREEFWEAVFKDAHSPVEAGLIYDIMSSSECTVLAYRACREAKGKQ